MCGEHTLLFLSYLNSASLNETPQLCQLQLEPCNHPGEQRSYSFQEQRKSTEKHFIWNKPIIHNCNCTAVSLVHIWQTTWRHHHTWQHEIFGKENFLLNLCCEHKHIISSLKRNSPAPPISFWSTGAHVLNPGRRVGWRQSTYTEIMWRNTNIWVNLSVRCFTLLLIYYLSDKVVSPAQRRGGFCEQHKLSQLLPCVHKSSPHYTPLYWGQAQTALQQTVQEMLLKHQLWAFS